MSTTANQLWPVLLDEYDGAIKAVLDGELDVLSDKRLRLLSPDVDKLGNPQFIKGGFGWVLPFSGQTKLVLKLFMKELEDRVRRYPLICGEIAGEAGEQKAGSRTFVSFEYQEKALAVERDSGVCWYPGLVMDWCAGERFDRYVDTRMSDGTFDHARECSRWLDLVAELRERAIAHGDLNHRNIYVSDGALQLIDYDGMYVPAMRAQFGAVESGLLGYQRPSRLRDGAPFDARMDDFSHLVILTTLAGLTPESWSLRDKEGLVLTHDDLLDPTESTALRLLARGPEPAAELVELLTAAVDGPPGSCAELEQAARLLGHPLDATSSTSAKHRVKAGGKRRSKDTWEFDPLSLDRMTLVKAPHVKGEVVAAAHMVTRQRSKPRRRRVQMSRDELAALGTLAVKLSASDAVEDAPPAASSRRALQSLQRKFSVDETADLLAAVRAQGRPPGEVALTRRQQQVLELRSAGADSGQIAELLGVQARTVQRHLDAARKVLEAETEEEAIGRSHFYGLIDRTRGLAEIASVVVQPTTLPPRHRYEMSPDSDIALPSTRAGEQAVDSSSNVSDSPELHFPGEVVEEFERVLRQKHGQAGSGFEPPPSPPPLASRARRRRRRRFGEWFSDVFGSSRPAR